MIEYGFDAANAPDAATAKIILTDIGGSWVAVYVGGIDLAPIARKTWTPQRVREYVAAGITEFLPIYVPLQGAFNPAPIVVDAVARMRHFGWMSGPVYLDVEAPPKPGMLDSAAAWVAGMRARGYQPGVYGPLTFLAQLYGTGSGRPGFAWFAHWLYPHLRHDLDPMTMPGFDPAVYPQRVWQYTLGEQISHGVSIDGNVSNAPMARPPGGSEKEEPLHPSVKNTLVRLIFHRLYGNEIPTIALRDAWAAQIADDGSNLEDFYVRMAKIATNAASTKP
jgi:hypothetical protein